MTKICGNCHIEKDKEKFRLIKDKRVGKKCNYLCSMCKDCEKNKALEKYKQNMEVNIEKNKNYKKNNKEKVNKTRREYLKKLMENLSRFIKTSQ